MKHYLVLLRPSHWIKNLFLFLPLFFAGKLFNLNDIELLFRSFISFCLAASSIYVINDTIDVDHDRKHPEKKKRPIAAGTVSVYQAYYLSCLCFLCSIGISIGVTHYFPFIILSYWVLNILYTFILKNIPILDILTIAIGFELRVIAGGIITSIFISEWLLVMVFLLALFLSIAKRRDDILIKNDSGIITRKSLQGYSKEFLDIMLSFLVSCLMITYLLYILSEETMTRFGTRKLYITALFVISGLFRYLQLTYVDNNSGSPVRIFYRDHFIQIAILLWGLSFYFIIYAHRF